MNIPSANDLKEYLKQTKGDNMGMDELQQSKAWYLSKTLWTNFILGVAVYIFPQIGENISEDLLVSIFAVVNIILRAVTKDKIQIK